MNYACKSKWQHFFLPFLNLFRNLIKSCLLTSYYTPRVRTATLSINWEAYSTHLNKHVLPIELVLTFIWRSFQSCTDSIHIPIAFLYFVQSVCSTQFHKVTKLFKCDPKVAMICIFYRVFYTTVCYWIVGHVSHDGQCSKGANSFQQGTIF